MKVIGSPVDSLRSSRYDLPIPLTTFIGRRHGVMAVSELLDRSEVRLLSLTGPGGVGKTRLAIAVADALADHFTAGVRFVGLAPLIDPDLVVATVAQALDVREIPDATLAVQLIAFLREKH